jgi:uncharacterized protein (TIGR02145 family)
MKSRFILATLVFTGIMASGQRSAMQLDFTAIDNTTHAQLDSIRVMNRTQGCDTVLYWPDTVLNIYFVGIREPVNEEQDFRICRNYPNPVIDQSFISLYVPENDEVKIIIADATGRVILKSDRNLAQGIHHYRFTPGSGNLFFFSAQWRGKISSFKLIKAGPGSHGSGSLEYLGNEASAPQLKVGRDSQAFSFIVGDELLYIGYRNDKQTGLLDAPEESESYIFQFATNIPCPGTPTVLYEGQLYHTIQIFSQCWLKENLNVGQMISNVQEMFNNNVLEKYCQGDLPDTCTKYGGLYKWWEAMQYINQEGAKGICPEGWHIPADAEWQVLEGCADAYFGVGDPNWDIWGPRGVDAGTNLKTTHGWIMGGNGSDLFGFSGIGGGLIWGGGNSTGTGGEAYWWTSSELNSSGAWSRQIRFDYPIIWRNGYNEDYSFSVRCVKD